MSPFQTPYPLLFVRNCEMGILTVFTNIRYQREWFQFHTQIVGSATKGF